MFGGVQPNLRGRLVKGLELSAELWEMIRYLAARREEPLLQALRRAIKFAYQTALAADRAYVRSGLLTAAQRARFRKDCVE